MFQAWLVQRVVREVLPLVVDTVRAQLRNRQAAAAPPEAAPAISPEAEARFNSLQDDLRRVERGIGDVREELGRNVARLLLWNKILAIGMVALFCAMIYLLLSR